jgi:hypothetical protein
MSVTGRLDGDTSAQFRDGIPDLGDDLELYPESAIDRLTDLAEKLHLKFLVTAGAAGTALGVFLINYQ